MALFDELKDRAMDVAQTGIAKSKQLAEIVKLKAANLSEEDNLKKAYLEVGKLYYAERGMAPEAAYAALCEKITACKVNIEENNTRIEALRQNEDGEPTIDAVIPDMPVDTSESVVPEAVVPETEEMEPEPLKSEQSISDPETKAQGETQERIVSERIVPETAPETVRAERVVPETDKSQDPTIEPLQDPQR